MASLPRESASDLRAQARISEADIVLARQFVGTIRTAGSYLDDKGKVSRIPAPVAIALFNAKPLSREDAKRSLKDYYWINAEQRFLSPGGALIKPEAAKGAAHAAAREARFRLLDLCSRLDQGTIEVDEWWREYKGASKVLHTAEYALGSGGFGQLAGKDHTKAADIIYQQWAGVEGKFPGLRAFADDVNRGRYGTPGDVMKRSFLQRAELHANAGNLTYENARIVSHGEQGYTRGQRVRAAVRSCRTCIEEDGVWRTLDELIQIGDCECGGNCHCTLIFE